MGLVGIVRAQSWEDAYSIVEDEFLHVVSNDQIYEAYGFDSQSDFDARDKANDDTMDLIEGYSYQSNSTGSGIVEHDLNGEQLSPLTVEACENWKININVILAK